MVRQDVKGQYRRNGCEDALQAAAVTKQNEKQTNQIATSLAPHLIYEVIRREGEEEL